MGFDAGTIEPVSQGVPVFTQGDQLWVESYYNQSATITVYSAGVPPSLVAKVTIGANSPSLIYSFGPRDVSGNWLITLEIQNQTFDSQGFTVQSKLDPPLPQMSHYSIESNGTLAVSFSANLGFSYLDQGCFVGEAGPPLGTVDYPSELGGGAITANLSAESANFIFSPSQILPSAPFFEFWIELYYPYAFASPSNPQQLTTSDVLAARTAPITVQSSLMSNETVPLVQLTHLRQGRYELRAYFRDSKGLQLQGDTLLYLGGKWVWFSACDGVINVGANFSFSESLGKPAPSWPTGIFTVGTNNGIEGVGYVPIRLNLTRISIEMTPFAGSMPPSVSASTARDSVIANSTYYSGSLYLSLTKVPTAVIVSIGYPGEVSDSFRVTVTSMHSASTLGVPFGEVIVLTTSGGVGVPGVSLMVNSTALLGKTVETGVTSSAGTESFYLLAGNYTLGTKDGSFVERDSVQVSSGATTRVSIAIDNPLTPALSLALVASGVFGTALNIFIWRGVVRNRRRLGGPEGKDGK